MVFCMRFWPSSDAQETQSGENYVTAHSHFDQGPPGAASTSRSVDYISSGVPNLNGRSTTLREFKLAELNEATKNFDQSTKIGQGGFGSVHLGVIKGSEPPFDYIQVAVKRGKNDPNVPRQWQTEVDCLGKIQHPNLVKLIGYCYEQHGNESHRLLVYEYMANGSLDHHLSGKSKQHISWPVRLNIARDAAICLKYLHEGMRDNQIIFRDFKPSNVLLDENWNAKLSDCGFVREGPQEGRSHVSTLVVGTTGFAAPEYIQTGRLTYKIDVWSYGIFLQQLITGRPPAVQKNSEIKSKCTGWVCCCTCAGKPNTTVDPKLGNEYSERSMQKISFVAEKCLVRDPNLRPTMSEVLVMVTEAIALQTQQPL
ncbi:putative protein kinase RLK-Pelle-RLCK-VIIa-2 family [Helianthus annuus]|nr:putative protein kinase RLK-Pelle-RLCK-VIIa-2 family [Helianthus annuus]KAJ0670969.1 putative protein kinase RLK-Pelle-RLCK-VIIa-2 family [Helianthus annuus]KAJ0857926.1 putative protein kinase RLK-Pelle-RLCK-VIIa-2 family [Helianthus annuus]